MSNHKSPAPSGFSERLKDAIDRAGITQRTLAHKMHVSASAVSKWLSDSREPDLATLTRLAAMLGVSTDWLLGVKAAEKPTAQRPSLELVRAITRLIRALDAAGEAAAAVAREMPDEDDEA